MTPEATNIACAERLGWKQIRKRSRSLNPNDAYDLIGFSPADPFPHERDDHHVPNFHGSMDAAMQLVERAKEMGYAIETDNSNSDGNPDTLWRVSFIHRKSPGPEPGFSNAKNKTLSAAICEAFLKLPERKERA